MTIIEWGSLYTVDTLFKQRVLNKYSLPVIVVKNDKATIATSEGNLVALVVPPVGVRLSIDHVTENDHVPEG